MTRTFAMQKRFDGTEQPVIFNDYIPRSHMARLNSESIREVADDARLDDAAEQLPAPEFKTTRGRP